MTSFNNTTKTNAQSFAGERNKDLAVSEIAGVIGGLLGGAIVYSEGGSKVAAVAGALCGAAGGYAMGNILSPISNFTTSTKILTGIGSGCFGISVAGLAGAIVDSFSGNNSAE